MNTQWHAISGEEVLGRLSSRVSGLTQQEVSERIEKYGKNQLPSKARLSGFVIFAHQFASPLIYILLIALALKVFLQDWIDVYVIGAAVAVNAIIGFIQEYKSESALHALKEYLVYKTIVYRNGEKVSINTVDLVPGDIIELFAGDKVPADARLLEAHSVEVNEAALTGESMPVEKNIGILPGNLVFGDQTNILFLGTSVARGQCTAVVVATGTESQLGQIASMLKETEEGMTPLQESVAHLGTILTFVVVCIALLIIALGFIYNLELIYIFETAVAIAVAVVPEGLVISITVILALGMQRMIKEKSLVRRLVATETLGSATVICTDKTGTLTEGKMSVESLHLGTTAKEFITLSPDAELSLSLFDDAKRAVEIAVVCNDASFNSEHGGAVGDTTEIALLSMPEWYRLHLDKIRGAFPRLDVLPFDSEQKYMAVLSEYDEQHNIIFVKGAVDHILPLCGSYSMMREEKILTPLKKKFITTSFDSYAAQGLRTLGFAYLLVPKEKTTIEYKDLKKLIYSGFVSLQDPLRKESKSTYLLTQQAGIRTVIITGDHKSTVVALAQKMGMTVRDDEVLTGSDLEDMDEEQLQSAITKVLIFARVQPNQKLQIINAFKKAGEVVAMIGDGVNDAPALKAASIGVAVGSGTDVAKEASDMVLLDDNYKTIALAIKQGRILFDNIKKTTLFLLVSSFTEVVLVVFALLLGLPLPITALQILFINIVTDGFPHLSLAFEGGDEMVMKRKPTKLGVGIFDKQLKSLIFIIGLSLDIALFSVFYWLYRGGYEIDHIRTIIFMILGIGSLMYIFSCKSFTKSLFKTNIFDNMYLIYAVLLALGLQLGAYFLPFTHNALSLVWLSAQEWLIVIGVIIVKILIIEVGKSLFFTRQKQVVNL